MTQMGLVAPGLISSYSCEWDGTSIYAYIMLNCAACLGDRGNFGGMARDFERDPRATGTSEVYIVLGGWLHVV